MTKRDYYEVLGVSRDATQDQIKKSYRQLALKFHPDRNPGDKSSEESFKEATEAYQVLSSDESRAQYDRFGHAAFASGAGGNGFGDFSGFAEEIFGDIFGAFFGTSNSSSRSSRSGKRRGGRDLRYSLSISLEEAAAGSEKKITLKKPSPCKSCKGTGNRDGAPRTSCAQCGGQGQIRIQQGFFQISRPCVACGGRGTAVTDPCSACSGSGSTTMEKELLVQVPAGIDGGQQLKLRGEGEELSDGSPPGDLYVEIELEPHGQFNRQGTEIVCEMPINYSQAVLGGEVEVPTLYGPIMMKIPAGTPSGKLFRLRGKGIVDMRTGRRGDQHVQVIIYVPQTVSDRQKELLSELAEIEGKPTANESRSFLERVKEFFE